jgi:hypothetical protein
LVSLRTLLANDYDLASIKKWGPISTRTQHRVNSLSTRQQSFCNPRATRCLISIAIPFTTIARRADQMLGVKQPHRSFKSESQR